MDGGALVRASLPSRVARRTKRDDMLFAGFRVARRTWRYQVDETRKVKHHWSNDYAGFTRDGGELVGKCPSSMTTAQAEQLLNTQGVQWRNPRLPALAWPDSIYVVDRGVVYRAVPTVAGASYHAFPELPERLRSLPKQLREQILLVADRLGCKKEVEEWMNR